MFPKSLLLLQLVLITVIVKGQQCSTAGQYPGSEFPVCGSNVFTQTTVPDCAGNIVPTPCAQPGFDLYDKNPFWYKFTCYSSGTLGFTITPNTLTDDYDWQLFDITGHNSGDVYTDPSLFVSCNWSGESGLTGASAAGTSSINCAGFGVPLFNSMPLLILQHNYLLMVSHYDDGSQSGYTLQFNGGTAGITDTTKSIITTATPSCNGAKISLKLNKKLKCTSLAADGSDFTLSVSGTTIVSAVGANCTSGFDMDSIILTLSNPLPAGTYTVTAKIGTDGNTLLDYCDAPMIVGAFISFFVTPGLPAVIDSIQTVGCAGKEVNVVMNSPVLCNSVSPNGSDFAITGPATVSITSATVVCVNSESATIKLRLSAPLYSGGIYQVSIKQGSDGNTLTNACLVNTSPGDSKSFVVADTVNADFSYRLLQSCKSDSVLFFGNANPLNNWNWSFDGSVSSGIQNPTQVYIVAGTHTAQLVVSNGVCSDTVKKSIAINPLPPLLTATSSTAEACHKSNGSIKVVVTGGAGMLNYLWTPGNYHTSSVTNLPFGKYYLTVTDSLNCQRMDSVLVDSVSAPIITSVVIKDVTCFNQKNGVVTLTSSGGSLPFTYQWSTNSNTYSGNPLRNADTGQYTVILNDARGCSDTAFAIIRQPQPITHSSILTNALCHNADGSAKVSITGGIVPYTYQWMPYGGNGSTATNLKAGNYLLTATDSNGCKDTTQIFIASIKGLSDSVTNVIKSCRNIGTGSATIISHGAPPYSYLWSPFGGSSPTATHLGSGTYTVLVNDGKNCSDTVQVIIGNVTPIVPTLSVKEVSCNGLKDAQIQVNTTGASPFSYVWMPNVSTSNIANGLSMGDYNVTIKDSFGCSLTVPVTVTQPDELMVKVLTTNTTCGLTNGIANAITSGGTNPYQYNWSSGIGGQKINQLSAGNFSLTIIDSNGCKITDNAIRIKASQPLKISLGGDIDLCPGDSVLLSPGSYLTYLWQDGSDLANYRITHAGLYWVRVWDNDGCSADATITVNPLCNDLHFPNAFSPNGDAHNDFFGAVGTLYSVSNFSLKIFDRWGQQIFASTDPYSKWDGKIKSTVAPAATYVWVAAYSFNGRPLKSQKGTIVLIK